MRYLKALVPKVRNVSESDHTRNQKHNFAKLNQLLLIKFS